MIYITSGGQLGRSIKERADKNQIHATLLSRPNFDLEDFDSIRSFFENKRGGVLVNTAACTNVALIENDEDERRRAFIVNAKAVGEMAYLCKEHDMKFIHISTDYVFNGRGGAPYNETDLPDPINVYGVSKLDGEVEAVLANSESMILRTSWLFSESRHSFVGKVLSWAYDNQTLNMASDQFGKPVYAGDLADLIVYLASLKRWNNEHNVYNAVTPHLASRFYFASVILNEAVKQGFRNKFGTTTKIEPVFSRDFQDNVARPLDTRLSCQRLQDVYGITMRDWCDCIPDVVGKAMSSRAI